MEETQRWEMSQQRTRCDTTAYSLLSSAYWYLMGGPGPSSNATSMKSCGTFSRSSCSFWKTHSTVENIQLPKNAFCCWKLTASEKHIPLLKTYSFWKTHSAVEDLQLLKNAFHCWKLTELAKCVLLLKAYKFWKMCSTVESLQLLKNAFCCWKLTAAEKHILPLKTSCFWKTHLKLFSLHSTTASEEHILLLKLDTFWLLKSCSFWKKHYFAAEKTFQSALWCQLLILKIPNSWGPRP